MLLHSTEGKNLESHLAGTVDSEVRGAQLTCSHGI